MARSRADVAAVGGAGARRNARLSGQLLIDRVAAGIPARHRQRTAAVVFDGAPRERQVRMTGVQVQPEANTIGRLGDLAGVDERLRHLQQLERGLVFERGSDAIVGGPLFPPPAPPTNTVLLLIAMEDDHAWLV